MNRSLTKNAVFSILYRAGNVIFPLISGMHLARILSPAGIGQVVYARNITSYFLLAAAMGIPQYAARETACCTDDPRRLGKLFSELMVINFCSTAAAFAAYLLFVGLAVPGEKLLYLIFGLELLFHFFDMEWLYQGREDFGFIALRSLAVKAASLMALVFFVRDGTDTWVYALILCLGTGANHMGNALHAGVKLSLRGLELKKHLKPILILMVSGLAASLYSRVDITMLGLLSSDTAVGCYTSGYRIIELVLTLVTAVSAVFFPRLSRTYRNDREGYGRYLSVGLKGVLLLAVPGCAGLMLVAEELISVLYGSAFLPAAEVLRILSPMLLIRGAGDLLCYQVIISSGQERLLIRSRLLAGLANVALNAILIPMWGQVGAAFATLVSEGIVNGVLLPHGLKTAKLSLNRGLLLRIAAATAAMGLAVPGVRQWIDNSILSLLFSVAAGIGVYFLTVDIRKTKMELEDLYGTERNGERGGL